MIVNISPSQATRVIIALQIAKQKRLDRVIVALQEAKREAKQ